MIPHPMPPAREPLPLRHAIALGLAQGPAELLPISSSAHTTLLPWIAGWPYATLDGEARKSFEVALHAGAGCALAIVLRRRLLQAARRMDARLAAALALSVAPAAVAGYTSAGVIERRFGSPRSIAWALTVGGVAMAAADLGARGAERSCDDAGPGDGLVIGIAQAAALVPGVSRNGATLTAARARGFSRRSADVLSWAVAMPVIAGASGLRAWRGAREGVAPDMRVAAAAGGGAAFVSTLASARIARGADAGSWPPVVACSIYRCLLALLVALRLRRAH